jgi:Arc/MetJ-type ribon-helix-helix transcriptional regulator
MAARRTVSLDPELDAFAQRRMKELGHTKFSHYIQELVREDTEALRRAALLAEQNLVALNEDEGNAEAHPHNGPSVIIPRQTSAGGSAIRQTTRYPTARQARSSK